MTYDATERKRLGTNAERVETLMKDFDWHTSVELMQVGGMRAVGRLFDLKDKGYGYDKRRKSAGVWEYRLTRTQAPEQLPLMEAR